MRKCLVLSFCFITCLANAQSVKDKLAKAVMQLEADSLLRHAIIGFYVADSKTGLTVYEHNAQVGLAPASTQKIFTSIAAFELLGKSYQYNTSLAYTGEIHNNELNGDIVIIASCDPSLGSERFKTTNADSILENWVTSIRKLPIKKIKGGIRYRDVSKELDNDDWSKWSTQNIPDGWIWQDIGNYYGSGAHVFNWRENQYDIILHPRNKRIWVDSFNIIPSQYLVKLTSEVSIAGEETGDNAYVYLPENGDWGDIRGTIPAGHNKFSISASMTNPGGFVASLLQDKLSKVGIEMMHQIDSTNLQQYFSKPQIFANTFSPLFDSLNYWFLRKSINLYGEAFLKTMAYEKLGLGSTSKGVELLKDFWAKHGIEKTALNTCDGSGLSPQNRVTANAEVQALLYAKTRPWFDSFYDALPTYNGMKMKSGSIGGARAFTGYHKAKDGKEYCFSIIVNNYSGEAIATIRKMYALLDILK